MIFAPKKFVHEFWGQRTGNIEFFDLCGVLSEFFCHHFELVNKSFDRFNAIVHLFNAVRRVLYVVVQ